MAAPVETTAGIRHMQGKWEFVSRENLENYLQAVGFGCCAIGCITCMAATQIPRFEYIVAVDRLVVQPLDGIGRPLRESPSKTYEIPGTFHIPMFGSFRSLEGRMSCEGDSLIQEMRDVSADKVIATLTSRVLADGNLHVHMCSGTTVATEIYRRMR